MTTGRRSDNPGVIALPPLILLAFIAGAVPLGFAYPLHFIYGPARYVLGIALTLAACTLVFLAVRRFGKAGTNVDVRKPATTIVSSGIYSLTRNPMYLSMALILTALSILLNNLWLLILTPVFMAVIQKGVIAREEAYLEKKFGAEYADYKTRVRRWV